MASIEMRSSGPPVAPARLVQPGEPVPDFVLPAAQGGEVSLSDFKGRKHVLLTIVVGMT